MQILYEIQNEYLVSNQILTTKIDDFYCGKLKTGAKENPNTVTSKGTKMLFKGKIKFKTYVIDNIISPKGLKIDTGFKNYIRMFRLLLQLSSAKNVNDQRRPWYYMNKNKKYTINVIINVFLKLLTRVYNNGVTIVTCSWGLTLNNSKKVTI